MFYGIVTQVDGNYTERQLRAYPLQAQRTADGAQAVPAAKVRRFRQRLRTPHVAHVVAGGIVVTQVTKAEADALLA